MIKHINQTMEIGKLPPQDIEVEEVLLGAIMLEKRVIENVCNIINKDSFYNEANRLIYSSIIDLYKNRHPIDMITVIDQLKKNKCLDNVGGYVYISKLTQNVASGSHADYHARIIQQHYLRREVITKASEAISKAYDTSIDVNKLLDFAAKEFSTLSISGVKKNAKLIGDIGKEHLKKLEQAYFNNEEIIGVPSFNKINNYTSGWQPGNLIILAARPAMGKTRIAQEFAKLAQAQDKPVLIFSLEMGQTEFYERELSAQTGIENMKIRSAKFSDEQWQLIEQGQRVIEDQLIYIDDTDSITIEELESKARQFKKKHNGGMIFIDYLQLVESHSHSFNREQAMSYISRRLKGLAKELELPIMALAQLNRDVDKRPDKTPVLADLRESGAIEQNADIVIFIHRPEYYGIMEDENNNSLKNLIMLIWAKHRHGKTGVMRLYKNNTYSEIYEQDSTENVFPENSQSGEVF